MQPISPLTFQWRGLTLGAAPFELSPGGVQGWLDLPDVSRETTASAFGHGWMPTAGASGGRRVTLRGWVRGSRETRDALIAQLRAGFVLPSSSDAGTEPLLGTVAGTTATVDAQLDGFRLDDTTWSSPFAKWSAQWVCPDPRKYADWLTTTVALTTASTGLALPQTLPFTLAASPLGGRTSIFNPGDDPEGSPLRVTLVGGQSGTPGVQVIRPSGRVVTVTYPLTLLANRGDGLPDTLVIDTARGGGYLNGEYRAPSPGPDVVADLQLPPGSSVVRSLGSAGAGSPDMTVAVRPRFW